MAGLSLTRKWLERNLPDSLFGRLALLLVVVAIVSHALALSLLSRHQCT